MPQEPCCPAQRVLSIAALGAILLCASVLWFANRPTAAANASAEIAPPPHPLREQWQSSKVTGSPDPPPAFNAARAFPNATFKVPLLFVPAPGMNRIFVGERQGKLFSLKNKPDAVPELAFDFTTEIRTIAETPNAGKVDSFYALAFHPKFEQNRQCFVCYTMRNKRGGPNLANGSRISRFTVTNTDPPRLDPASEEIIVSWEAGGHNGCEVTFGPDGYLYFSTGDSRAPYPPDALNTGQDCSDLLSSVLRIDVDHKDPGLNYAVPKDNPFVGMPNVRGEIWGFGFRNPWRMSFDRKTGDLWLGDVGWELWEMVHKVEKGGNYGWSIMEGPQPIKPDQKPGPTPIRPPVIPLPHTISASVTGGFVYRGKKFPELVGKYIFGDWEFRRCWAATLEDGRLKSMEEITRPTVRVTSFGEDYDGEIFFLDYDTGYIHTLERNNGQGQNKNFPTKLSDTGIFADVKEQIPARGVMPFEVNAPQWQDGATAKHWIALPENTGVTVYPGDGKPIPSQVYWHKFRLHFPKDAVLVKTLYLDVEGTGKPRKVETQLLHFDGLDWKPYSFAWREDGSDADMIPATGGEKIFEVKDKQHPSGKREHVWTFHSRTQCLSCHNQWPQYALGFSLAQLNRDVPDGHGGGTNQLVRLSELGVIKRLTLADSWDPPYDEASAAAEPKLCNPHDARESLDTRARSYLHANCSHCHRFGGGGAVLLDLVAGKELKEMKVVDVAPLRGTFGLTDARIVAPGCPERSTLYYRISKFGRDRMPHIGSEVPDEAGIALVEKWIQSLPAKTPGTPPPAFDLKKLDEALAAPVSSFNLARALANGQLSTADRDRVLAAVAKLPSGPVRDLFEGYLPSDGKARKLGSNPRPSAILSLVGDAKRGETLFWSTQVQCSNCHKIGDRGTSVGPDFTAIGKQRSREELLESILEPSKKIEPQFSSYMLRTVDGKSYTGLLVKRDTKQVILRDAQNKEIVVPAEDVEVFQISRLSLMPEAMLGALTAQEAADLLAYLSSRK